eukprot:scaffold8293_cov123-Isochrysis_galbana.AAC.3
MSFRRGALVVSEAYLAEAKSAFLHDGDGAFLDVTTTSIQNQISTLGAYGVRCRTRVSSRESSTPAAAPDPQRGRGAPRLHRTTHEAGSRERERQWMIPQAHVHLIIDTPLVLCRRLGSSFKEPFHTLTRPRSGIASAGWRG